MVEIETTKYEMKIKGYKVEVFFEPEVGWFVRLGDVKDIVDRLSYINENLKRDCEMWKNGYRKVYKELCETKQNERQKFFDEIKNLFK